MKKLLLFTTFCCISLFAKSQNTYPWPSSGNIGIGTSTPTNKLQIQSNNERMSIGDGTNILTMGQWDAVNNRFESSGRPLFFTTYTGGINFGINGNTNLSVANSGNVGIGNTNPSAKLYVAGGGRNGIKIDGSLDGTPASKYFNLWQGTGGIGIDPIGTGTIYLGYDQPADIMFGGSSANGIWKSSGNVGIGTTNPDQKLSVAGTIHSQAVKVDMNGWSDYVFKPDYTLKPLENIKAFIDKNHHLPDMPSEKEVIKNGVDLGEMVKLQQKKIEELTLYLIEKDKQMQVLQKDVKYLQKKNRSL